jgi:prolyl 4-hydroxylase
MLSIHKNQSARQDSNFQSEEQGGGEAVLLEQGAIGYFQTPAFHMLSMSPAIYWIENFLSNEECDHLIAISQDKMAQSLVYKDDYSPLEETGVRSSKSAHLPMGYDYTIKVIEARIASTTRLPLEFGEPFQVLNYQLGQEYKQHHDFFDPLNPGGAKVIEMTGQRIATMLLYLNDVPKGGETFFPVLNLQIPPKKGCALLFYNIHSNGIPDMNTLHASLPVLEGEKWLATKWIHDRACGNYQLPQ